MTVDIATILPGVASIISAVSGWALRSAVSQKKEQRSIKAGVVALIHDRLYTSYEEYSHRCPAPFASVEEMRNAEYLYKPYHALGGNGTGTELYERIMNMPSNAPKEKKNAEKTNLA